MKRTQMFSLAAMVLLTAVVPAQASVVVVNSFASPVPALPVADVWYESDVRPGGTASIDDLTGLGGNLELSQPLPTGAAHLVTDLTNAAKAEVGTFADYGLASSALADIDLGYSYYRTNVSGGNISAAPSMKLTITSATGTGTGDFDSFGYLVYEPYLNPISTPPSGAWQSVSINESTGNGLTASDGWWWTGGFGIASSVAGPPYRSLSEWLTAFQSGGDAADFATAHVVGVSIGVGSYNMGVSGYFDAVSIVTGSFDVTYDFQAIPEPTAVVLCFTSLVAGIFSARRRNS